MTVQIVDEEGNTIEDFSEDIIPIEVGDILTISVQNRSKGIWDVENVDTICEVTSIEKYLRKIYGGTGKVTEGAVIIVHTKKKTE